MKPGHKGERRRNRPTSHTCAPFSKLLSQKIHTPLMSPDPNTPLFEISDRDEIKYEDDPAVMQVKVNLSAVEHIQREKTKQRRLEREEQKAWAEAERLTWEIKEAERQRRELEEVELEWLTQEKERLEEEKRVEQQCTAALHGSERVVEQRRAVLAVLPPEAGLNRAPPQKLERTAKGADQGPGIIIPEKNCTCCVAWETLCWWDSEGCARSCKLCQ